MKVSVYLRSPKSEESSLTAQIYVQGRKMQRGIPVRVPVDKWDSKSQRVRTGGRPHLVNLNRQIDKHVDVILEAHHRASINGPVTVEILKSALGRRDAGSDFMSYVDGFIERSKTRTNSKGQRLTKATIMRYVRVERCLVKFGEATFGRPVRFSDWNADAVSAFQAMRAEAGVGVNTVAKDVSIIRQWMRDSFTDGLHDNRVFMAEAFKMRGKKQPPVVLSVDELRLLEYAQIDRQMIANVRDLFVAACWTGLRISDLERLPDALRVARESAGALPDSIDLVQYKTSETVVVPILEPIRRILERRGGELPRVYAGPVMNRSLKIACELAGLNRPVERAGTAYLNSPPITRPLHELVTMHTARRTFATNLYVSGGLSAREVMSLTGHRSEEVLLKYLNLDRKETAQQAGSKLRGRF